MDKEFTKEMVETILRKLAKKNCFFVSERHLQCEFIIEASQYSKTKKFKYYPEFAPEEIPEEYKEQRAPKKNIDVHFDLLIKTNTQNVVIEFKYVPQKYSEIINGVKLSTKDHNARSKRRHQCWEDISRIELFSRFEPQDCEHGLKIDYGYFVLITSNEALWDPIRERDTSLDYAFNVAEGSHPSEEKKWGKELELGEDTKDRFAIKTRNDYEFKYEPFYKGTGSNGDFRQLVVEID